MTFDPWAIVALLNLGTAIAVWYLFARIIISRKEAGNQT